MSLTTIQNWPRRNRPRHNRPSIRPRSSPLRGGIVNKSYIVALAPDHFGWLCADNSISATANDTPKSSSSSGAPSNSQPSSSRPSSSSGGLQLKTKRFCGWPSSSTSGPSSSGLPSSGLPLPSAPEAAATRAGTAQALATRNNLLQTVLNKLLIMRETARANPPTAGWKVNRREVTVTRANGRQVIRDT